MKKLLLLLAAVLLLIAVACVSESNIKGEWIDTRDRNNVIVILDDGIFIQNDTFWGEWEIDGKNVVLYSVVGKHTFEYRDGKLVHPDQTWRRR